MGQFMVMGVGNILLSDEGVGVHTLKELRNCQLPPATELVDIGTAGTDILYLAEGVEGLVIIDCIKTGAQPGAIYKFRPWDVPVSRSGSSMSLHHDSLLDALKQSVLHSRLPEKMAIFAIEPKSLEWGLDPSPEVKERIPKLAALIAQELWSWAPNY